MGFFKKVKVPEELIGLKQGDKVFITTFVKVYEGEVVSKDESTDVLRPHASKYIVKLADSSLLSVDKSMLTKVTEVETKES